MPARLAVLATLLCALLAAPPAHARTPERFFGVMADGPLLSGSIDLGAQARDMRANGVGSIRVAIYWDESLQPSPNTVPELAPTDAVVAAAAAAHLDVLPVVLRTPDWAASKPGDLASPPRDPRTYAAFLTGLIQRYGPRGYFWRDHPDLPKRPVRRWQIWNEPDISKYWDRQPFAASYVRLLKVAYRAVHAADPGAKVVLAGLTNRSWLDLRKIYAAGGRRAFDIAAAHPFSRRVANVVKIVGLVRREMRRHGDATKPLALPELSWSSGRGRSTFNYGWETTERGQADRVRDVLTALAKRRTALHLDSAYWYTWLSPAPGNPDSFDYSGLRRLDPAGAIVDKPALAAFRRTVDRLT